MVNGVPVNQSTTGPTVAYTVVYALDGSESHNKTPSLIVGRPETGNGFHCGVEREHPRRHQLESLLPAQQQQPRGPFVPPLGWQSHSRNDRHCGNDASDGHNGLHPQALSHQNPPRFVVVTVASCCV